MKALYLFFFIAFVVVSNMSFTTQQSVFICGPNGAAKYHLVEKCRGLSNCQNGIYSVSIYKARELGLGLCGWED